MAAGFRHLAGLVFQDTWETSVVPLCLFPAMGRVHGRYEGVSWEARTWPPRPAPQTCLGSGPGPPCSLALPADPRSRSPLHTRKSLTSALALGQCCCHPSPHKSFPTQARRSRREPHGAGGGRRRGGQLAGPRLQPALLPPRPADGFMETLLVFRLKHHVSVRSQLLLISTLIEESASRPLSS